MINRLKKYAMKRVVNELEEEPISYIKNVLKTSIYMIGLLPLVLAIGILIILFLFAFTHVFTAPSLAAQILFFILLICTSVYFRILRALLRIGSRIGEKATSVFQNQIPKKKKRLNEEPHIIRDVKFRKK